MSPRFLVLADSDSYVKWGAAFASRLPAGWRAELVILSTPVAPSDRQLRTALAGSAFDLSDVLRGALRAFREFFLAPAAQLAKLPNRRADAGANRASLISHDA